MREPLPAADPALVRRLAAWAEGQEGVTRRPMFGLPGFFTGRRCFACVFGDGVSLKIGRERAAALIDTGDVLPMVVWGRTMGGWAMVPGDTVEDLDDLLAEARAFVASGD